MDVSIVENWDTMLVFAPSATCRHLKKAMVRDPDDNHLKPAPVIQVLKATRDNKTMCAVEWTM
jgi:hypothetical protein